VSYFGNLLRAVQRPVPASDDFRRISALPRRALTPPPVGWEERWRLAGCDDPACPYHGPLLPFQRTALWEAHLSRGLLASAGLGCGKTLASLMMATVMGAERPVVMVPASLRGQTERAYEHLKQHWVLVPPTILTYSDLSNPKRWDCLALADPDLWVADECHTLASTASARGKRARKFMRSHPSVMFVGMSATPTKRSHRDYAPLFYWALRQGSPCPIAYKATADFALALDDHGPNVGNSPPGVLSAFLGPDLSAENVEHVREGYRKRMADTAGVVFTKAMSCDAAINCYDVRPRMPKAVREALGRLRSLWTLPDGTEFSSALDYARAVSSLAQGFWQRWTEPAPEAWLEARKAWSAEMRAYVGRGKAGIDSPGLYELAVTEGRVSSRAWEAWAAIRDAYRPVTETVWVDDFLVRSAASWASSPGIVWSRSPDWGRAAAKAAGVQYFGEGKKAEASLLDLAEGPLAGKVSIVLSIDAHYQGRNLQAWRRMFFPYPGALASETEQAIGRIHRTGQKADEVEVYFALTCPEATETLARAVHNARYAGTSFDQEQRLLRATWAFPLPAITVPTAPGVVDIEP
jgi:hypothetical protein